MAQHRHFGRDFKARVAIEAIKGEKTINEYYSANNYGSWGTHDLNRAIFIFSF